MTSPSAEPVLQVVAGNPSAEELAALVAVLSAAGTGAEAAPTRQVSAWADPSRGVRVTTYPGRGAWRTGSWPH